MLPSRWSPLTLAKLASATSPRACVLPLLNDPVIVPSEPMLKFTSEPLLLPSCSVDEGVLGAATCDRSGVVPLSTFQLNVWLEAPSARLLIVIGGIAARVPGVVFTVKASVATKGVDPAASVKPISGEVNGVPTVAVPKAPETEPTTENVVAAARKALGK